MGSEAPLTNSQESTGINTADFYNNMKTYIFAFVCVVAFLIIGKLLSLCNYFGNKRLKKFMYDMHKDFFHNGEIETVHFAYLQMCISFTVLLSTGLTFKNFANTWPKIAPQLWPALLIVVFPIFELCFVYALRDRLEEDEIKQKWAYMWEGVNLKKNKHTVLFKPI